MDQEAKYWRDKWKDVVNQLEALKGAINLDHNQEKAGNHNLGSAVNKKTATTHEKAKSKDFTTSVKSGERRKKCQKSTKS